VTLTEVREGDRMKAMQCPCGQQITGETDEQFVANVQDHINENHPELAGKYTDEQILARAQEI
jgi:hypothetical protein